MTKPTVLLRGAWVKWHVLDYLGMRWTKRFRHLIVTDETSLQYWEKLYSIKRQP